MVPDYSTSGPECNLFPHMITTWAIYRISSLATKSSDTVQEVLGQEEVISWVLRPINKSNQDRRREQEIASGSLLGLYVKGNRIFLAFCTAFLSLAKVIGWNVCQGQTSYLSAASAAQPGSNLDKNKINVRLVLVPIFLLYNFSSSVCLKECISRRIRIYDLLIEKECLILLGPKLSVIS